MTEITDIAIKQAKTFPDMLKSFLPEIQRALPKHLNGDRMARIALTAFRRMPKLGECDPRSVFAAVIQASQLGLEPDTLGRSYLVPYGRECQFIPGWKGLVELLNRSGQGTAWTGAVFQGDEFEYMLGDSPHVKHRPAGEYEPEKLTHVYAVGRAKGSDMPVIEVWTADRVRKHRDRYNKVGKGHYSFKHFEMYARKVVLLQVLKYMPASPELVTAMELDYAAEATGQHLNVNDAIDGTWAPVPESDAPESEASEQPASSTETIKEKIRKTRQESAAQKSSGPTAKEVEEAIDTAETIDDMDLALDLARGLSEGQEKDRLIKKATSKQD